MAIPEFPGNPIICPYFEDAVVDAIENSAATGETSTSYCGLCHQAADAGPVAGEIINLNSPFPEKCVYSRRLASSN